MSREIGPDVVVVLAYERRDEITLHSLTAIGRTAPGQRAVVHPVVHVDLIPGRGLYCGCEVSQVAATCEHVERARALSLPMVQP